jgi:hypothetical protein
MISKTAAIVGFALSCLAASFTSAAADVCADINAKVAQIQKSMAQMDSERARVDRMKPMPYTDAANDALSKCHRVIVLMPQSVEGGLLLVIERSVKIIEF